MKKLLSLVHNSRALWGMIMTISLCCWTACSNEDEDSEPGDASEYTGKTEPVTRQDSLNIAFMNIVSTLCETDSTFTPEEDHSGNYKAAYGTLLYTVTPTVRYKMADNTDDAQRQFLQAFAAAMEFNGAQDDGTTFRIDLGERGRLEFERTQGEGRLGVLNVNIPQIPDLTQVIWLQADAWPQNEGNGGTYVGQTFKSPQGYRWVCVRTSESSEYGLLITFDDELGNFWGGALKEIRDPACNGQDAVNKNGSAKWDGWQYTHYYSDEKDWKSWTHGCYATADELKILNMFMYNNDGSRDTLAENVFSNPSFMSAELYKAVYTDGRYYCCNGYQWDERTKNKHEYKLYYYSTGYLFRKNQWVDGTQECTYQWCGSRWYVMRSKWWESKRLDDRWNSYASRSIAGWQYRISDGGIEKGYDEWTSRNYDKRFDHVKYPKVVAYPFHGDFYNKQTGTYQKGFVNFDITRRR